jgi:hypothetical protein
MEQRVPVLAIVLVPIVTLCTIFVTFLFWVGRGATGRPGLGDFILGP